MGIEKIALYFCLLLTGWMKVISSENIEQVQILLRHGERTPVSLEYNLMKNMSRELFEPYGSGQLTNKGKMDMYNMGQILRARYGELLGDKYKPDEIYARSSDYDRSITALQLVLAALFPPAGELIWNSNLNWFPVPIHTTPASIDNLFLLVGCPRYKKMLENVLESEDVLNNVFQYAGLINRLNQINPNVQYDLAKVFRLKNLIQACETFNIPLPNWFNENVYTEINSLAMFYLNVLSYTPEMIRLNGGPIVRRFIENIKMKSTPKMYLYSGHKFNLHAVLQAHNVSLPLSLSYGSAIILEKVRNDNDQLFVRMFYFDGDSQELLPLSLFGSNNISHSINSYLSALHPILPSDQDLRCLFEN